MMAKFVLTTKSESGDDYIYFIETDKEMNAEECEEFLMEHGIDRDEERTYENVIHLERIDGADYDKFYND